MITLKLLSVLSTSIDSLHRRVVKAWNGKSDTRTAKQYDPPGIDSNPIKDMVCIYGLTELDGSEVIIGYLNKNQLAASGEFRTFSTDENGTVKFNVWLKSDGTVLMGTSVTPAAYTNFAVKFNELKIEFNEFKAKFNAHTHVTTCPAGAGSAAITPNQSIANIDNVKNAKIKTN